MKKLTQIVLTSALILTGFTLVDIASANPWKRVAPTCTSSMDRATPELPFCGSADDLANDRARRPQSRTLERRCFTTRRGFVCDTYETETWEKI